MSKPADMARAWMVSIGVELLREADRLSHAETKLLEKLDVISTCAELPDDMVLRLRCLPNVWLLKA